MKVVLIQTNQLNSKALQFIKFLLNYKIEMMRFILMGYIGKFQVNMKLHYDLRCKLHDKGNFLQNIEMETLLQQIETSITKDVTLTLPKSNQPLFINIYPFLIGGGSVLHRMNDKGKLDIFSYRSCFFTINEQKLSTTTRNLI